MKIIFFIILLSSCSENQENAKTQAPSRGNELTSDFVYDSTFVLKEIGYARFHLVRENYKEKLQQLLQQIHSSTELRNVHSKSVDQIITALSGKIDISNVLQAIPQSPAEFKIYDSCFTNKEYKNEINQFEGITYKLAGETDLSFSQKIDLCVLLTNMYGFLYSGILLDETRVGDGYYFYTLNSIICQNAELYCTEVWSKVDNLAKSPQGDLYQLYKCRCERRVVDEYDFCE